MFLAPTAALARPAWPGNRVDALSAVTERHREHLVAQEEISAFRRPRWTDRRCATSSLRMLCHCFAHIFCPVDTMKHDANLLRPCREFVDDD